MKMNKNEINKLDEEYSTQLEKEWRESEPRLTDKEWLEVFPEFKEKIPFRIEELKKEKLCKLDIIEKGLTFIRDKTNDEISRWFWKEWLKVTEGQELLEIEQEIARLERLSMIENGQKLKGQMTKDQIQQALAVPIESLIKQPLQKSGKALVGLCPFHQEKHPSFFVYPDANSFYCYGCNQGGNVINFVRLLYGYSFKEAIKYLIGEK